MNPVLPKETSFNQTQLDEIKALIKAELEKSADVKVWKYKELEVDKETNDSEENKKPKNNIPLYADRLLACAKRMKNTCRYVITKEQMVFGFFEGENDLAPGKVYDLNAFLKKIEEKRGVPFIPFACDSKSLEQFINIVYPGTFKNNMSNVI